jgi:UTP-glucose-1-phosphate uridylyltransferase
MKCLNCSKNLEQTVGKRERRFCNSTCRSNYWQKQQVIKKGVIKSVKINKDASNNHTAKVVIEMPKIVEKPKIGENERQARIRQLEYELAHPPKTFTISGMKYHYFNSREAELKQLKQGT